MLKKSNFLQICLKKKRLEGKTIIIVTHNVEFAMDYIPRTILMSGGEIIADGPTHQVLTNEFLCLKSSLLLPQIHQFNLALRDIGIISPNDLFLKNTMTAFLMELLKKKDNINEGLN